jgi:hypothetical protein
LIEFLTSGRDAHFDSVPLAADEPIFSQDSEVLGERRLGDSFIADAEEAGAILRALLAGDIEKDGSADGIGQGVEDALDGDVIGGRMDEGPHFYFAARRDFRAVHWD